MKVQKEKSECGRCVECGKSAKEANLHAISIEKQSVGINFFMCYSCLKEFMHEAAKVRPEGTDAFSICEDYQYEPEDARDCLHCCECVISTQDGFDWCFECLWEHFFFYEENVPETKKCGRHWKNPNTNDEIINYFNIEGAEKNIDDIFGRGSESGLLHHVILRKMLASLTEAEKEGGKNEIYKNGNI